MTPLLLDMRRIKASGGADKLRYDLIAKTFGQLCAVTELPPAGSVVAAAERLDSSSRAHWRRAVAEELLLRHNCGKPVPPDWIAVFGETSPLEDDVSLVNRLRKPSACALFPLATSTERPGVGHVWVFGEGLAPEFFATHKRRQGYSWQLAAELARIALRSGDRKHIETLATRWIVTGTCENGRIGPVEIGNKLDIDTRRHWIVPASLSLPDLPAKKRIFRAATTESAFSIVTGQGFQRDSGLTLPHSADVLHSFVSPARLPVLLTALAVRPKRIMLWVSDKSVKQATDLKECLLPHFLPDLEIDQRPVDSCELEKVEWTLRPVLRKQVLRGEAVVFNLTNGNFIQKLAATGIAANYPDILLVYSDADDKGASLTTLSYLTHPPRTCPNVPSRIDGAHINLDRLTAHDNGETSAEELLVKLMPEKC